MDGRGLGGPLRTCEGFVARGLGFMGRRRPADGHGLVFRRCGSLHTWFMRFDLDVVFLDREGRVLRTRPGLRPWRFALGGRGAVTAVEAPVGTLAMEEIEIGDVLEISGGRD